MLDLLIIASYGAENATRASLPFFLAKAAKEKGKQVAVALAADAAPIAQSAVRDRIQGLGMPSLAELYGFAQAQGIPIYIWGGWAKARGVSVETLTYETVIDAGALAELITDSAKALSFWITPAAFVIVLVAVIDYPYPSGYGTAIGGAAERCVLFIRGGEYADSWTLLWK